MLPQFCFACKHLDQLSVYVLMSRPRMCKIMLDSDYTRMDGSSTERNLVYLSFNAISASKAVFMANSRAIKFKIIKITIISQLIVYV